MFIPQAHPWHVTIWSLHYATAMMYLPVNAVLRVFSINDVGSNPPLIEKAIQRVGEIHVLSSIMAPIRRK